MTGWPAIFSQGKLRIRLLFAQFSKLFLRFALFLFSMERVKQQIQTLDEEMRQEQTLIRNEYGKILEGIKEKSRHCNKEMDMIEKAFQRM